MRKTAEKLSEKAFFLLRYFNIFVNIVAVFIGDGFPFSSVTRTAMVSGSPEAAVRICFLASPARIPHSRKVHARIAAVNIFRRAFLLTSGKAFSALGLLICFLVCLCVGFSS